MHFPQIKEQFVNDYLDKLAVGCTHEEAIQQVAIENEVLVSEVAAELEVA